MQCIHSPTSKDTKLTLLSQLPKATYQPAQAVHLRLSCGCCPLVRGKKSKNPLFLIKSFGLSTLSSLKKSSKNHRPSTKLTLDCFLSKKTWLQAAGLCLVLLPTESLTSFYQPVDKLTHITASQMLTVAMTNNQLFIDDAHMHSFELDAVRRYAEHLGVGLTIRTFDNTHEAKLAVSRGLADMFIGVDDHDLPSINLGCHAVDLSAFGLDTTISFAFSPKESKLFHHAKDYLCQDETIASTKKMAKFYQADFLDSYSEKHFARAISQRLPSYEKIFKAQADKYNHDWELLVAISYQESHLDPEAISRTGVQGLMMLTNDTAALMGVKDRTDPLQSIQGGAKYLKKLNKRFDDIPPSERLWFVLSAYNMGPNSVRDIQSKLKQAGKDPNSWSQFYSYLADNAHKNSRYVQCMHYVTNIRHYLEVLKGDTLAQQSLSTHAQYRLGNT